MIKAEFCTKTRCVSTSWWAFWSIASGKGDGNVSVKFFAKVPKKFFFFSFTLTYTCFLTSAKRVNAQTGRRKHFCQISCDEANAELTQRRLSSYLLSGQLLALFQVCSLHFLYILLPSCHGASPLPPSTDKTNPVSLLQPLDGNIFNIHFFFLANFSGGLPPFDWTAGSNQLQAGLLEGKLIWGQDEQIKPE